MKKVQNYRHNMHLSTQSVLNTNAGKLISIPGYPALKDKLDKSIAKELSLENDQYDHKIITAAAKNRVRSKLGEYTLELGSKVSAVALMADDLSLLDKVKLTATYIKRISDNLLEITTGNVLTYAGENLEALAGYDVTVETLAEGTALLEAFRAERMRLALIKKELKNITKLLEEQLRATLAIIHVVDALIETRRFSDQQLYSWYWIARAKRNSACTKVSVKGVVFEEATGEPLPGAILTVVRTTTTGDELVKKIRIRSANGGFQFSLLTTGKYIFKVTYAGCISREFTVYFNEGVLTHVELPMIRID